MRYDVIDKSWVQIYKNKGKDYDSMKFLNVEEYMKFQWLTLMKSIWGRIYYILF